MKYFVVSSLCLILLSEYGWAKKDEPEFKVECPKNPPKVQSLKRSDVYKGLPYGQGEVAEYDVRYMGTLVGRGTLEVKKPFKYKGAYAKPLWHRQFHAEGKTGDWYKYIFVAHDKIDAIVRPWDHGVSRFYMSQDEGQIFGRRLQQQKWLEFNHKNCKVTEKVHKVGKKEKIEEHDLAFGAMDTLGVVYWLRERKFKVGKRERALLYSSEKNWWLEAAPLAEEEIKVGAGKFKAFKIKLQTYIGQELQQKGDVLIWIASNTKHKQLLLIKAEIKIGSVWIEMMKYKPGRV